MIVQRRFQFPTAPRPAKPSVERWTIEFSGRDTDIPVVCRIRRLLKVAWRAYGLRAKIVSAPPATTPASVESLPPIATPPLRTGNESSEHPQAPQTAFAKAVGSLKDAADVSRTA